MRKALLGARQRTLALAHDYRNALGPAPHVPYAQELNPPLWEWGHVAWFQEWWIPRNPERGLGVRADPQAPRPRPLLPEADAWYDSSRVPHRERWQLPLPGVRATDAYLEATLARTLALLDALPAEADDDALYFFRLAVAHEQMHAEAAAYMAQGLGIPLRESAQPPLVEPQPELELAATRLHLGTNGSGFAFDNELDAHEVALDAFAIDATPVTWGTFLPFLDSGGYEDERWWSAEGRAWLGSQRQRRPAGLRRAGGDWEQLRGGAWQPLQPRAAVTHVSAHEAEAWCRWAGRQLPTEAQWECAARTHPGFRWGHAWEWTASPFQPYAGFTPHPYRDYSKPWFGSRRVLRGASPATAPVLADARYRNFYPPDRRDIFAGFRSVRAS